MKKIILLACLAISLVFVHPVFARLGVGVGTGKIEVDDILKPGQSYNLPSLTVLNTGDEKATYKVLTTYHEQQTEKRPEQNWFTFTPNNFELEPGKVQEVAIALQLPIQMEPGTYFAYLEAQPTVAVQQEGTSIGIAAAAKLYFTVEPASIFQAVYYRLMGLYTQYKFIILLVAGILVVVTGVRLVTRFVSLDIKVKSKAHKKDDQPTSD